MTNCQPAPTKARLKCQHRMTKGPRGSSETNCVGYELILHCSARLGCRCCFREVRAEPYKGLVRAHGSASCRGRSRGWLGQFIPAEGLPGQPTAWFYVHQPILPRKWSCRISFPSRACRVRRRWRGAGTLLDGGGSCPRCRGRGEVLGPEDGGFAAGAGAQRPRGSASRGSGCSWGQTPCSAAARPAPRRAGGAGLCSALGLPGLPSHGGASPEQGLGAAPPAPGAAQGCVNAAGPGVVPRARL